MALARCATSMKQVVTRCDVTPLSPACFAGSVILPDRLCYTAQWLWYPTTTAPTQVWALLGPKLHILTLYITLKLRNTPSVSLVHDVQSWRLFMTIFSWELTHTKTHSVSKEASNLQPPTKTFHPVFRSLWVWHSVQWNSTHNIWLDESEKQMGTKRGSIKYMCKKPVLKASRSIRLRKNRSNHQHQ